MDDPLLTEQHDPYVAPVNILFRGGSGGNFLNYALEKFIYNNNTMADTILNNNEYSVTRTNNVRNTHLNMWFKPHYMAPYGSEVYSVSKYKNMIKSYKLTKVIFIQPYNNYEFTESVGAVKNKFPPNIQRTYYLQLDRHYRRASAIFKKHGIEVYNVNYAKLFKFDTEHEVKKLCVFLEQDYKEELVTVCNIYNQKNEQLLAEYDIELFDNNQ